MERKIVEKFNYGDVTLEVTESHKSDGCCDCYFLPNWCSESFDTRGSEDNSITLTYEAGYCTISKNRWAIDNPGELTAILQHFYSIINGNGNKE